MNIREIPRPWEDHPSKSTHHTFQPHSSQFPQELSSQEKSSPLQWIHYAKSIVDHMGGIEGVLSTMTKVHGMVQQVHQIAPLIHGIVSVMRTSGQSDDSLIDLLSEDSNQKPTKRRKTSTGSANRKVKRKSSKAIEERPSRYE